MAVRFIIGRAGSGKTHHCLTAIRNELRQNPVDGRRLILLVPEQASLQMERAIVEPPDGEENCPDDGRLVSAVHRAEVLSFQRLALRVSESVGGPVRRALSDAARVMVLRHLVAERSSQLHYYRRLDRIGGFVDRLAVTITELLQEDISPDDLLGSDEGRGPGCDADGDDPVRGAKLHDLSLLYAAYLDYLGTDRLDPSQHLQVARECLPRCDWVSGAELWVDGFASLSEQESQTLVVLARMCSSVELTVLLDPSAVAAGPDRGGDPESTRLFARTLATFQSLRAKFREAGLEEDEPLRLCDDPRPRFRKERSLSELERTLFSAFVPASVPKTQVPSGVELVELPSRRVEVDYAVSQVCHFVQRSSSPLRYRDIAIIARDLEPYHDLLTDALDSCAIPFFIDRRRPMAHHPLVELLRAGAVISAERMSLESVRLLLKTGLMPLSADSIDALENYLIEYGIAGLDTWRGEDWSFCGGISPTASPDKPEARDADRLARVNEARRSLFSYLDTWLTFARADGGRTGAEWASGITELLVQLHVPATLEGWANDAEEAGDLDAAEEHRQAWRDTMSFIDDLAFAFAEVALTIEELTDVLETGLSSLTLGLVPPMVDQVLVGSIERSRHPNIKAAVIVGFNDGVFPKRLQEDSILNDDDRGVLRDGGVGVGPPARERTLDESMLAYIALTRASEHLVVTYTTTDENGAGLRPSPYVEALESACPGLTVKRVGDPYRRREMWDIQSERDVRRRLTTEFGSRPTGRRDDTSVRCKWNELYESVRVVAAGDEKTRGAFASLGEPAEAGLLGASVERLYDGPFNTSVSQLETYAACPFQHFARYTLRLRERREATVAAVDVGQVHHAILEDFANDLSAHSRGFGDLGESELHERLSASCDRVAADLLADGVLPQARNSYVLRRSAARLARVIQAQRRASQRGGFRPRAAELPFGFRTEGGLPALELSTPTGRRVVLRGYIDRVDLVELADELLGVVIDYKRTPNKRLDMSEVYHGLSLQLPAYLLTLAECGQTLAGRPIRPVGALYVSLTPRYHSVAHPGTSDSRDAALSGTYRPRGLLAAEDFGSLDDGAKAGWSDHYNVYFKKDGTLGHPDKNDAVEASKLRATLDHTRTRLGELADGVLDGDVAVKPYRLKNLSPCTWCAMGSVCGFEMGISDVRFLASLGQSEVFRILTDQTK